MKKFLYNILVLLFIGFSVNAQSVGINATGSTPNATAGLDIDFNDRGVLIPRLTLNERGGITAPANGLIVYNTDCGILNYYDCDTWREVGEKFSFPTLLGVSSTEIIVGNANPSENETGVVYQVPTVSGTGVTYNWTVPPGATIVMGQGNSKITVDYTTPGDGFVCVEAINNCGSTIKTCLYIQICPLPQVVGPIAGNATPNENSTGSTYSIATVADANDYTWTVPAGATITGGQGTTSITVDFAVGASNGDICVVANNDCGTGSAECISLTIQCPVPTVPVAIAASNIIKDEFDANWSASTAPVGTIDYYLDVATDAGFTNFVPGFNNLLVNNVTTYNVNSLICETNYYYRVRAENLCGTTVSSNTISVMTGTCCPTNLVVGDPYEGGIVYDVTPTGSCQTGLIVDLNDLSAGASWGGNGTSTGATSTTDGATNTSTIVSALGGSGYAAELCQSSSNGGFTDWFLPAKDQLQDLYNAIGTVNTALTNNGGSAMATDIYLE